MDFKPQLEKRGKTALLEEIQNIVPRGVTTTFIRQPRALGLGHAVLMARDVVGDNPFAVLLADDLILSKKPVLLQMKEQYSRYQTAILAIQQVLREECSRYGIIASLGQEEHIVRVGGIVEKPSPESAPSNLGVVGRYVLPARIFDLLEELPSGAGGEIQLTDAIARLALERQVLGYEFEGQRFDCGDKFGYLQAIVEFALRHPEFGKEFKDYLDKRMVQAGKKSKSVAKVTCVG
ncbi:UTP--glucose-1-phosphate uridylyltransferase [Acidithiobacillus concretivorus]|uniref:UTP--glucose-1-phosphate uridylyltransferase n=1 Tax=Acidithiobacillus concretivorus TaxID=3063952 RepID=UPI0034A5B7B9